jgi:transcriptional repressor NrdR
MCVLKISTYGVIIKVNTRYGRYAAIAKLILRLCDLRGREKKVRCPACKSTEDRVLESRTLQQGEIIRRRRECDGCKHRFTSYERVESQALMVLKKDGRRELFNHQKFLAGLIRAFEKRPIEQNGVEKLAFEIEAGLRENFPLEVSTDEIGKIVVKKLAEVDQIAYIRFASVYRNFEDVQEFIKEVNQLLGPKGRGQND